MRPIIFLGSDELLCGRVQAAADGVATVLPVAAQPENYVPVISETAPLLVLVELEDDRDPKFLAETFAALGTVGGDFAVVVIGDSQNAGDVLAAVRAGSVDFIDRDETLATLRDRLARRVEITAAAAESDIPSTYSVVFNAQPGSGAAMFALNLAILRAQRSNEALLIDCELPVSDAGTALDLTLTYSLADAVRDVDRLDRTLLLSAMARHEASGLRVLPLSLGTGDNGGLSPETFLKALRTIRPLFNETVLNAADIREPALVNTLTRWASKIYLVCPQKFTALRDTKDLLKALPADATDHVTLVVDEYDSAITLTPAQMQAALGIDRAIELPMARAELINGLNYGRPYILEKPDRPYALALRSVAGVAVAEAGRSSLGLLGRLRGRK